MMKTLKLLIPNRSTHAASVFLTKRGFTLLELTVVITILILLIGASIYSMNGYKSWKLGQEAGMKLRLVNTAQKTYLSEHPTEKVTDLTDAKVIPYLSDGSAALPTIEDLEGNQLTIKVDKSPPYIEGDYDPSGKTDDGQWDVGK